MNTKEFFGKMAEYVLPAFTAVGSSAGTYWVLTKIDIVEFWSLVITIGVFVSTMLKSLGIVDVTEA